MPLPTNTLPRSAPSIGTSVFPSGTSSLSATIFSPGAIVFSGKARFLTARVTKRTTSRASRILKALALFLLAHSLHAQPLKLTLAEAEAIAIKNNPNVSLSLLNAAVANQITFEIRAAYSPTLNAGITGAGSLPGTNVTAFTLNNSSVLDRFASGLAVSQLITDFGRTANLAATARLRASASDTLAKATRSDVLLQVDQAYFGSLRATSVLTVATETVKARQLVVDQVTALAQVNLKSGLDVSFAQVNLSDAKLLLLNAENNLKSAYADLAAALGYRDRRDFELTDEPTPDKVAQDPQPFLTAALQLRPEILASRTELEASRKFIQAESDLKRPIVSGVAVAGVNPLHEHALRGRYAAAGINVTIPILNGHLFAARKTEAELRSQAAEQSLHATENRIARDVQVAYLNATTAYQRMAVTAELLTQATQALDLAQARYDLGLSSIVELSQTQLNLTAAQIASATAKYEYGLQRIVLDYHSGATR